MKNNYHDVQINIQNRKKAITAFTLVELMIAVAIIGLLASIGVNAYQKYIQKSKMSEAYSMLRKVYDGAMVYASEPSITIKDGTNGYLDCIKIYRFGTMMGWPTGEPYIPGLRKMKVSYYIIKTDAYTNDPRFPGSCLSRETPDPRLYGVPLTTKVGANTRLSGGVSIESEEYLTDPMNFIYAIRRGVPEMVTAMQADGKNVADEINNIHALATLWAMGDLDGDYNMEESSYSFEDFRDPGERDPKLMFIMRGIYIDTVTGDIMGTDGLYEENRGE